MSDIVQLAKNVSNGLEEIRKIGNGIIEENKELKAEVARLEAELSDAQSCVAKMEHEANNRSMINSRRFRDE